MANLRDAENFEPKQSKTHRHMKEGQNKIKKDQEGSESGAGGYKTFLTATDREL